MSEFLLLVMGWALLMTKHKQERTKHIQGWSRQNWLSDILIIVSLYVQS